MSISSKKQSFMDKLNIYQTQAIAQKNKLGISNTNIVNGNQFINKVTNYSDVINNNSDNPIPLLITILMSLVGKYALQTQLTKLINKKSGDINNQVKNSMTTNATSSPTSANLMGSRILKINVSSIKITDNKDGGNTSLKDKIYESINSPGNDITYNNMILNYHDSVKQIWVTSKNSNVTYGAFIKGFISTLVIINKQILVSVLLDILFGTVKKFNNLTKDQINDELQLEAIINKLIDNDDDQLFTLSDDELNDINSKTDKIYNNDYGLDFDCGDTSIYMDNTTYNEILNSADPIESINNFFDNALPQPVSNIHNDDANFAKMQNNVNADKNSNKFQNTTNSKGSFFEELMKKIISAILKMVISSVEGSFLLAIMSAITGGANNIIDLMKNNSTFVQSMSIMVRDYITNFLLDTVKKELLAVVTPVLAAIAKEKLDTYTKQIESLA